MFLFTINLVISMLLLFKCLSAYNSSQRGTNTLTRFVRDTSSYFKYKTIIFMSIPLTMVFTLLGMLSKSYIAGLPSFGVAILCVVLQIKSNRSDQRKIDARKVTKTTGKAVAKTAAVGGTAIATAVCPTPATAMIAGKATEAIGAKVDLALDSMDPDVIVPDLSVTELPDPDVIAQCRSVGIQTDGKTKEELYNSILAIAPRAVLNDAPKDLSSTDLAKHVLRGMIRR